MANNYTTVSKKGIEYLCSLINQLANVSEGIDDLNLRTDGTFSSVKIDTLLNTLKTDCNDYTDRLVANLSRLELKIATSESEITQPNTMYLYKPSGSTSYEQYVVIEGTKVLLGTTDINMGDYYTISQTDAKFVLKTDFDSLKTEIDKKVNKTDIVDNLTSTDTDKPLSANQGKVLKDEVDLKANDSDVVKKTDIVTTIDNTSTDDKVPSAKAVLDRCIQGKRIDQSVVDTYGTEILKYPLGRWVITSDIIAKKFTDLPIRFSGHIDITSISYNNNPWYDQHAYRVYFYVPYIGGSYVRKLESGSTAGVIIKDTGWQRICITNVLDVPKTTITPVIPSGMVMGSGGANMFYVVKNGWCTIRFSLNITSSSTTNSSWIKIATGLPKPATGDEVRGLLNENGKGYMNARIKEDGCIYLYIQNTIPTTEKGWWNGAIVYPVAES